MKIEITFLGTGSHIPTATRNHTGILLSFGSENILFDCGEGTQRQFRVAKLNPCKLTKILISHWHGDHALGLPGLLKTLAMSEYSKTLHIYGPKGTKKNISLLEKIYGKAKLKLQIHEISSGKIIDEKEFIIKTLPMKHGIPTNAYSLIIKDKLRLRKDKIKKLKLPHSPLLSKLQQGKDILHPKTNKKIRARDVTYLQKGKKVTIIMDTSINKNAIKLAKNSDLLICEATYTTQHEKKAKQNKHLMSKQAAEIAKKAKVKKLILTHISCRYEKHYSQILQEAKKILKNTSLVKDFDKVVV